MADSTVFKTNRTQAVRIPKELAYSDAVRDVVVTRSGDVITIVPKYKSWKDWFENGPHVSEDFMVERDQPLPQEREPL